MNKLDDEKLLVVELSASWRNMGNSPEIRRTKIPSRQERKGGVTGASE